MSTECCADPGARQTYLSQGHEETIAGLNTYTVGQGKAVIVIFTDVFGYAFINTRKIADTFAQATGSTVLIPDFFNNDPMDTSDVNRRERLTAWLQKHPAESASQAAGNFLLAIQGHYDTIQVNVAVRAAVVAHPSRLVAEEAAQIKRPILFQCAETDQSFTPELREHFERTLAPTNLAEFIDYPGTHHGFVIRPDGSEQAATQWDRAVRDAIEYFKKSLVYSSVGRD